MENKKDNKKQKPIETTGVATDLTEEEVLDQYDEEPDNTTANTEETNNNSNQEESTMNTNENNTQAQNNNTQQTAEPTKKSKVLNGIKTFVKWTTIIGGAGAAGWFGHKIISERGSSEPSAEDAFI